MATSLFMSDFSLNFTKRSAKSDNTYPWLFMMCERSLFNWSNASMMVLNALKSSLSGLDIMSRMLFRNCPMYDVGRSIIVLPVWGL